MIIGCLVGRTPFSVSAPALIGGVIANGTSVVLTATAELVLEGGFPPYTYNWTENTVGVFIQASTSATTRLQVTGTDTNHTGKLICSVTDSQGIVVAATLSIAIQQGTP